MSDEYPNRIVNIERMVILIALEEYAAKTKDSQQRSAIMGLREKLLSANTITLDSTP